MARHGTPQRSAPSDAISLICIDVTQPTFFGCQKKEAEGLHTVRFLFSNLQVRSFPFSCRCEMYAAGPDTLPAGSRALAIRVALPTPTVHALKKRARPWHTLAHKSYSLDTTSARRNRRSARQSHKRRLWLRGTACDDAALLASPPTRTTGARRCAPAIPESFPSPSPKWSATC